MASITSANAVLTMSISGLFNAPFQLQGFSGEDIYTSGPLAAVETIMGLDGKLSGGFDDLDLFSDSMKSFEELDRLSSI